jgi:phospholipid/cholesterol/gamma-HCH transport system substrate-binding protein
VSLPRGAQNAPGASARSYGAERAAYVAPYDPDTGTTTGPDGRPVEIGSTGGEQTLFGKESWQWLLVGPMA